MIDATVKSGGSLNVLSGGHADPTTIDSGGTKRRSAPVAPTSTRKSPVALRSYTAKRSAQRSSAARWLSNWAASRAAQSLAARSNWSASGSQVGTKFAAGGTFDDWPRRDPVRLHRESAGSRSKSRQVSSCSTYYRGKRRHVEGRFRRHRAGYAVRSGGAEISRGRRRRFSGVVSSGGALELVGGTAIQAE